MNKDRCLLLNKLIVNNIYCIFFVFILLSYFPMQNFEKICVRMSVSVMAPVMVPR